MLPERNSRPFHHHFPGISGNIFDSHFVRIAQYAFNFPRRFSCLVTLRKEFAARADAPET
jgi:hypothetical protein